MRERSPDLSDGVVRVIQRPGILPAFLTSAGVLVYLIVVEFLHALLATASEGAEDRRIDLGAQWAESAVATVTMSLPFAIGVLISFWQIAPIAPVLRLAHVVTRAILATVIGAFLSFLVSVVVALWVRLVAGDLLGGLGADAVGALLGSLGLVVDLVPLVVLGAILLWGWLQRHPRDYRVSGTLDEV